MDKIEKRCEACGGEILLEDATLDMVVRILYIGEWMEIFCMPFEERHKRCRACCPSCLDKLLNGKADVNWRGLYSVFVSEADWNNLVQDMAPESIKEPEVD